MTEEHMLQISRLHKTFTLHQQHGVRLNVLSDISFAVNAGECLVLAGRSGTGKSTLLRTIYGNYLADSGSIQIRHQHHWLELVGATPRQTMQVRFHTLGYVSQFLRVIPRVSTLNIVMTPALERGWPAELAQSRAEELLTRLNIPSRLWQLAPGTFSGGEQQRVNIARAFMVPWPVMLLDEPTASLDDINRAVVLELINEAKSTGSALVGIFHDHIAREMVGDRQFILSAEEQRDAA